VTIWYEQEEFWEAMAPKIFSALHWDVAPLEIEKITALLEIKPGSRVLDLCCGPGRHSLELARLGFRVTGVDRTSRYLDEAREKAKEQGLYIDFLQEDMRE
jgi:2-polyprenyl-3-methyl-5-hydroxy-6-metoxy-1,4-benzoquinol methylase